MFAFFSGNSSRFDFFSGVMVSSLFLRIARCAAATSLLVYVHSAVAFDNDQILLGAGLSRTHESNLFRLADGADTAAVLGRDQRSDDLTGMGLSLALDKQWSLQRLKLKANAREVSYATYDTLDYREAGTSAEWLWAVADRVTGRLGSSRDRTLTGFADFRPGAVVRNLETRMVHRADVALRVNPDLHVDLEGLHRRGDNSEAARQASDYKITERALGVRYTDGAGREWGLRKRWLFGEYPNRLLAPTLDNSFEQQNTEVSLRWAISGASRISGSFGRVDRHYDNVPARNYAGNNGRLAWDWTSGGRTAATLAVRRELTTQEDFTASFLDTRAVTFTPVWGMSERLVLQGNFEKSRRSHEGDPGFFPLGLPTRVDRIRNAGLSLAYEPRRWMRWTVAVQDDRRDSNVAGVQYRARTVSLGADLRF